VTPAVRTGPPDGWGIARARRLLHRHRRWVAAGLAGLAVWTATGRPAGEPAIDSPTTVLRAEGLALPIRLGDEAALPLLHPGDRVAVVGPGSDGAVRVIARELPVLAVPAGDAGGGLLSGSLRGSGTLVVDVTESQAVALTAAAALGPLAVAVHP
jgi:hypothetical protein